MATPIILVPTDLSVNSRAGMRFALQLEKQGKNTLVFYHCIPFLKPTRWSDARYEAYVKDQKAETGKRLMSFVKNIYQTAGLGHSKLEIVIDQSPDAVRAILAYASRIGASAICMSTRGGGRLKKLIGTHAAGIVHGTSLPVFVIPKTYRRTSITSILYASDLNQVGSELAKVRAVSRQLKAEVLVYHYDYLANVDEARRKLEKTVGKFKYPDVSFKFQKYNIDQPLAAHLLKDMRKSKASLAVLFTDQKRGWFDKLFMSSKSVDVVYDSKIPLLIFPKG